MTQDNYWLRRAQTNNVTRRRFVGGAMAAGVGAASLGVVGCGDDDDDSTKTTPSGGQATTAAGSPTAAAEQPVRGGTLRLSKAEADTGIDPQVKVVNIQEMYPKLYSFTHSYRLSTDEVLVDAASGYEQPDPLQLTFKLRDGMKFHNVAPMNGRVVTAEDVAFVFNRFAKARKDLGGQTNEIIWGWMDSVTAPDATTVVIKQKFPFASNLAAMGGTAWAIWAKEAIDKDGLISSDAGSGPYVLKKRDASGTRMERNPDYFKRANPAKTYVADGPYIDNIDTRILGDAAAVKAAFLSGDLDVLNTTQVIIDKLTVGDFKSNKDVVVETATPLAHIGMAFDMLKFTDPRAREAISLAIDRDALIANIYAGDGTYEGPVCSGLKTFAMSQSDLKGYQKFDPKKAKELWAAAGNPFPTLRMVTTQLIPAFATMTDFIAKQLEANLGIKVKIENVDIGTYVSRAIEVPTKQWELFVASEGSAPTIPDYNSLTHYIPKGYGGNTWMFKEDSPNPEVAKLAKEMTRLNDLASSALKVEDRKAKLIDLQKFAMTNFAPWLSMPVAATAYSIVRKTLRNYPHADSPSALGMRVQDLWIAKA